MFRIMTKLLIVGPAWVGDMVMAQSLFKLCKQLNPQMLIDVLAPDVTRPLLSRMPEINKAIALPLKHGEFNLAERYRVGTALRQEGYHQVIVLANSWKSALIPFFARIPQRTGWRGEMRWGLLNDVRYLDKQKLPLMIERFMALGLPAKAALPAMYPKPQLKVSAADLAMTVEKLRLEPQAKPVLALCPGAEYGPAKRWPAAYFAELANAKLAEGWQVWLMGGPKDQTVTQEIQQATANHCIDLAGKTRLTEALDLLSLAQVVVSNDSGLMHIAAALQRPLVVVYGSTDPRFTPPLSEQVKILSLNLPCSPCFKRECPLGHLDCLNKLTSQQVLAAIQEFK